MHRHRKDRFSAPHAPDAFPASSMSLRLRLFQLLFSVALTFALAKAFVLPRKMLRLFHWDKAEHFTAFYVMTVLAAAAFPRRPLLQIAVALSLLGAGIELVQALPFVDRDSDFWDWFADTLAILAAFLPLCLTGWRDTWQAGRVSERPARRLTRSVPCDVPSGKAPS